MKQKRHALGRIVSLVAVLVLLTAVLPGCVGDGAEAKTTYEIRAEFDPETMTVTGTTDNTYRYAGENPVSEISLHLYGNTYREGAVHPPVSAQSEAAAYPNGKTDFGGMEVTAVRSGEAETEYEITGEDGEFLTVRLPAEVRCDEQAELEVDFVLKLANIHHRLGYGEDTVNLGNWYPVVCALGKDGFLLDPYDAKGDPFFTEIANYDVTFTAPREYVCAFGGEVLSSEGEEQVTYTVRAENVRDFAAVLSTEFEVKEATAADGTEVRYYYHDDDAPEESLGLAVSAIDTFGELFGEYAYEDYAVVQADFCHGGMEYPQLVYISDTLTGADMEQTIVHETAHQWWYAAVGNDQIREAYLDEGLAEYSTALYFGEHPTEELTYDILRAEAEESYRMFKRVVGEITGKFDSSMNRALPDYRSEYEYVVLTYRRGFLLFDGLQQAVGKDSVRKGLSKYYEKNKFRTATANDLIGALSLRTDVSGYFLSFVEGRAML